MSIDPSVWLPDPSTRNLILAAVAAMYLIPAFAVAVMAGLYGR